MTGEYGHGVVVCGSPGEVANDLRLGGEMKRGAFEVPIIGSTNKTLVNFGHRDLVEQRDMVWMAVSLWAKDQLRQRMAWALYQLFVINGNNIKRTIQSEDFLAYHDIFVQHAFGNFRNVLKQVAYNRMMGEMLSYVNNKSTGHYWTRVHNKTVVYPDEV